MNSITEINHKAPVTAEAERVVHTPADIVWELHTDINCRPMWLSNVSDSCMLS